MPYARILGTGSYLPDTILTNTELAKRVETTDEWIVSRTGIQERRLAAEGQLTSDLAYRAALRAIEAAGIEAASIEMIIVATTTPDMVFPSTAVVVQERLGLAGVPAFDVQAVCAGFMYAFATANAFIRSGQIKRALVIGAETLSRLIDWDDRRTCILFGDGAGAVVLGADEDTGVLSTELRADGRYKDILKCDARPSQGMLAGNPFVYMDGQAVFKFAVKALADIAEVTLAKAGKTKADLDWLVPHQANLRIIEATARHLALPMDKVVVTLPNHANTSAASVPLALDAAVRDGRIRRGELLLLEGIGGGFAWGSALLHY
ncbi:beta-ketoacyl-ACP synthase III [Laribacter hongkongensis]|uniref:beta-ketoacyl-ACP synthase III n=1 Tax=Laribacter hongkongensis TaxID=168471 RepID=UPI001EFC8249|nr:beta-ketoacyl-ACP synthase III [Laribacter hongkongensis]MCG9097478.1 ketoacyl-ACP synthase III [Laribacter hongkongensis]